VNEMGESMSVEEFCERSLPQFLPEKPENLIGGYDGPLPDWYRTSLSKKNIYFLI
jgi:hypothetical protein